MKSKHIKTYYEIYSSINTDRAVTYSVAEEAAEIYAAQWSDTLTRYRSQKEDTFPLPLTPRDRQLLMELRSTRPVLKEGDLITFISNKDNPIWEVIGVFLRDKKYRVRRKLSSGGYRIKDISFKSQKYYRTV